MFHHGSLLFNRPRILDKQDRSPNQSGIPYRQGLRP